MRDFEREEIALAPWIRKRNQHLTGGLLVLPARFDRRKFRRLMLRTYSPVKCPKKSWIGINTATNPRLQCSITRPSSRCTPRSRYQAPVAAMVIALVRNAASSMCGQRTIWIGPSTIVRQSAGAILPSTMA